MSFLSAARAGTVGIKPQLKEAMGQVSSSFEANANLQSAITNNGGDAIELNSGYTNPAVVHESEKYDVLDALRTRLSSTYRVLAERTLGIKAKFGIEQLKALGGFEKADIALNASIRELATLLVSLGEMRSYGWKLNRIADAWGMISKYFFVQAQTIRMEAPSINHTGVLISSASHVHETTADLKVVQVKNEIHRVADAFGLDAKYLTLLLSETAKLQAMKNVEVAAKEDLVLSAAENVSVRAGSSIHLTDGAGGSITMQGGVIHINPVTPPNDAVIVVSDVENLTPTAYPRVQEYAPNMEGAQPHVAGII